MSGHATGFGKDTYSNTSANKLPSGNGQEANASNVSTAGRDSYGHGSHTEGPHSSKLKNFLDPRVDSNAPSAKVRAEAQAQARAEAEEQMRREEAERRARTGGVRDAVKNVAKNAHGAGETIRGRVNGKVDERGGDHASAAQHREIASRGEHQIGTSQ